jgi:Phage integrase, N-terminal SAM-like domain
MLAPTLIADRRREREPALFSIASPPTSATPNTRAAYALAVHAFFSWLDDKRVEPFAAMRTHHVSAHVEVLGRRYRSSTIKQHLAAIRMLFDWLVVVQILANNPAHAVRGPKHPSSAARRRCCRANGRATCSTASMCRQEDHGEAMAALQLAQIGEQRGGAGTLSISPPAI